MLWDSVEYADYSEASICTSTNRPQIKVK